MLNDPTPHQSNCDRLDEAIKNGDVIRGKWTVQQAGRQLACLLATIAPECGLKADAAACPAEIMPAWLAHLTPWIDDSGSLAAWPGQIAMYARLLRASSALTPEGWQRLNYRIRAICVREARSHVEPGYEGVLAAIDGVLALLDKAAVGANVPTDEWSAARSAASAARSAAYSAAWSTASAAYSAAESAASAAYSAAESAASAARSAAKSAAWSAAESAASAAYSAAYSAAADRMIEKFFVAWQDEITSIGNREP